MLEWAAVLLLFGGIVFPVLGWLAGVVLLWASGRWTTAEKLLGTLVVPGGLLLPVALLVVVPGETCSTGSFGPVDGPMVTTPETCTGFSLPPAVGIPLLAILLVAPVYVAIRLANRAGRAADLERAAAAAER